MKTRFSILLVLACAGCGEPAPDNGVAIVEVKAARAIDLPAVQGPGDASLPLVVIDAGHGGRDPGAIAPDLAEKDVTLAIADAIRDALIEAGGIRVAMTREDDRQVALADRPEIARRLRADLFLSIHADAAPREGAQGASIYTLSEVASDREAAALAHRENASASTNVAGGAEGEVAAILFDLAQRESLDKAADFAALLHREGSGHLTFREDHRRFAALAVLKSSEVPSLLLECGYLTNAQDAAFLRSGDGQRAVAQSVRRAVQAYFARRASTRERVEGGESIS